EGLKQPSGLSPVNACGPGMGRGSRPLSKDMVCRSKGNDMLISQINNGFGDTAVVVRELGEEARFVKDAKCVYDLAMEAANAGRSLMEVISHHGLGTSIDLFRVQAEGRFLLPIMHPDPAHLHLTGTGLTHLGSAATRDSMHKKTTEAAEETLTDS